MTGDAGVVALLCKALRARLGEALANMLLETPQAGVTRTAQIKGAFLPPKRGGKPVEADNPPFILVRPVAGSTGENGYSRVKVQLIICTYAEDDEGAETCIIVLERIRRNLFEFPLLDERYYFEKPFDWIMPEDQPYPNWQIIANTEWTIPTPQLTIAEGDIQ